LVDQFSVQSSLCKDREDNKQYWWSRKRAENKRQIRNKKEINDLTKSVSRIPSLAAAPEHIRA
jgi:hypothetical protein